MPSLYLGTRRNLCFFAVRLCRSIPNPRSDTCIIYSRPSPRTRPSSKHKPFRVPWPWYINGTVTENICSFSSFTTKIHLDDMSVIGWQLYLLWNHYILVTLHWCALTDMLRMCPRIIIQGIIHQSATCFLKGKGSKPKSCIFQCGLTYASVNCVRWKRFRRKMVGTTDLTKLHSTDSNSRGEKHNKAIN